MNTFSTPFLGHMLLLPLLILKTDISVTVSILTRRRILVMSYAIIFLWSDSQSRNAHRALGLSNSDIESQWLLYDSTSIRFIYFPYSPYCLLETVKANSLLRPDQHRVATSELRLFLRCQRTD